MGRRSSIGDGGAVEHWGWGAGEASVSRQGWPEGEAWWLSRKETQCIFSFFLLHFLLFNWADKGAHVHVSRCTNFKCQLSAYRWVRYVRFNINSSEIDNQCKLQQISKNLNSVASRLNTLSDCERAMVMGRSIYSTQNHITIRSSKSLKF
jgi:hypothetical protein